SLEAKLAATIDEARGLRADEAVRRAVSTSPDIQARDASLAAARAAKAQTERDFLPRLSGSARYARLSPIDRSDVGTIVVAPGSPPGPLAPGAPLVNAPLSFPVLLDQTSVQSQLTVPVSDYLLRLTQRYDAAKEGAEAAQLQAEA